MPPLSTAPSTLSTMPNGDHQILRFKFKTYLFQTDCQFRVDLLLHIRQHLLGGALLLDLIVWNFLLLGDI